MVQTLAQAIAARAGRAPGRLPRLAHYARQIGLRLGWEDTRLRALLAASILHDAGEIAAPAWTAALPPDGRPGPWSPHVFASAEMLESMGCDGEAAAMVRSHHERWDGSGYPDGLRGEAIPAGARVLAVADCLAVLPMPEAREALRRGEGAVFDPGVVAVVERSHADIERAAVPPDCRAEAGGWLQSLVAAARKDRLLNELMGVLGNSLNLAETLGEVDARLRTLIVYHSMAIWTPRENRLAAVYVSGEEARWLCSPEIAGGRGVPSRVAETRQAVYNGQPSEEGGYAGDGAGASPPRSVLAVPLERGAELAGVLALYHKEAAAFLADDLEMLLRIRAKLAAAVDNALRYESMERLSMQDPSTSLPNERALFLRLDADLARCRRHGGTLAVLVCDVAGEPWTGQPGGASRAVAAGLRRLCREEDCVARMGDRFVLVLGSFAHRHLAEKRKRMEALMVEIGAAAGGQLPPVVNVGEAFYPDDGRYAEDLLAVADARMNLARYGKP
jgi:diguanylate cyclase (GGDEF)-like protein